MIVVEFRAPGGERWEAVGGGVSLADAIAFARESCPAGVVWEPVAWEHLHGE